MNKHDKFLAKVKKTIPKEYRNDKTQYAFVPGIPFDDIVVVAANPELPALINSRGKWRKIEMFFVTDSFLTK